MAVMVDVPDDTTTTAVLEFDQNNEVGTYSGTLDFYTDVDWIHVTLQAGVAYQFFLSQQAAGGSSGDSFLALLDAAGTQVASDDDGGSTFSSFLAYTPSASGTYFVGVSSASLEVGSYSLLMTRVA